MVSATQWSPCFSVDPVSATHVPQAAGYTPKFSFFGLGGGVSDAYNQNDADAVSPYSQFSNPKDAIYKKGSPEYNAKKKVALDVSFKRLATIPELIKGKNAEGIKSALTSQSGVLAAAVHDECS